MYKYNLLKIELKPCLIDKRSRFTRTSNKKTPTCRLFPHFCMWQSSFDINFMSLKNEIVCIYTAKEVDYIVWIPGSSSNTKISTPTSVKSSCLYWYSLAVAYSFSLAFIPLGRSLFVCVCVWVVCALRPPVLVYCDALCVITMLDVNSTKIVSHRILSVWNGRQKRRQRVSDSFVYTFSWKLTMKTLIDYTIGNDITMQTEPTRDVVPWHI